jgi:hypothetical protein
MSSALLFDAGGCRNRASEEQLSQPAIGHETTNFYSESRHIIDFF